MFTLPDNSARQGQVCRYYLQILSSDRIKQSVSVTESSNVAVADTENKWSDETFLEVHQ